MQKGLFSITLFNTGYYGPVGASSFGCASAGIAAPGVWHAPDSAVCLSSDIELEGYAFTGTLPAALTELDQLHAAVKAGVVLFGNCGGENAFMRKLGLMFPGVPFVGGAAAFGADSYAHRVLPRPADVSLLLITDDRCRCEAESVNVHSDVLCELTACGSDVRHIGAVCAGSDRLPLRELIAQHADRLGVIDCLCEHFTVSDVTGRNIHLIPNGDAFDCGCDLPADRRLLLRYTSSEHACAEMDKFYARENSLIFGCAGLKALCGDHSFITGRGSLGAFLYGETVFLGERSDFANLMLSRLTILNK